MVKHIIEDEKQVKSPKKAKTLVVVDANPTELSSEEDDDELDSDDESEAADIAAADNMMNITFEYNDMEETYTEGVTTLLRDIIQKPHLAYEIARVISSQAVGEWCMYVCMCVWMYYKL